MPSPFTTNQRLKNLGILLRHFQQGVEDYDHDSEEDLRPYFNREVEPAKWCCVTLHHYDVEKHFFLPRFNTSAEACERAVEYVDDDIFHELPECVVDLDTLETFEPVVKYDWRAGRKITDLHE